MTSITKISASLLAAAVLAAAATAAAPAVVAGQPDAGETIIELVRTRLDGPASFTITVQHPPARDSDIETMGAGVLLKTDEHGAVTDAAGVYASSFGRQTQPTVSANGTSINACTVAGECQPVFFCIGNATQVHTADEGTDGFNRFYMAFHGFRFAEINLETDGWEMRVSGDLTGGFPDDFDRSLMDDTDAGFVQARYVGSDDADGAEVVALGTRGLEVFLSAALPGPERGSVAFALPPCSTAHVPVGLGTGGVTLTGGTEEATTSCDTVGSAPAATGIAGSETTWTAEGPAVGDPTLQDVRLVVFDLPDCSYLIPGTRVPTGDITC